MLSRSCLWRVHRLLTSFGTKHDTGVLDSKAYLLIVISAIFPLLLTTVLIFDVLHWFIQALVHELDGFWMRDLLVGKSG